MFRRWVIAVGVMLALVLLTLPALVDFTTKSFLSDGGQGSAVCTDDAKPAPMDFTLKDMNGEDLHLASLKGKVVLLNFWATWCGPCKLEMPGFIELQKQYGEQGFQVLGLSVDDTPEQMKPFAEELGVNYPMLVGLGRDDFQEAYGPIFGLPISFWIDREGILCKTHLGIAQKEDFERELKELL